MKTEFKNQTLNEIINFSLIEDDNLYYFSVDDAFETITVGHIQSLKDNKRKYVSTTYGLNSDQSNLMKSNITRFNNTPDKVKTLNLSENEMNNIVDFLKTLTGSNVNELILDAKAAPIGEISLNDPNWFHENKPKY